MTLLGVQHDIKLQDLSAFCDESNFRLSPVSKASAVATPHVLSSTQVSERPSETHMIASNNEKIMFFMFHIVKRKS